MSCRIAHPELIDRIGAQNGVLDFILNNGLFHKPALPMAVPPGRKILMMIATGRRRSTIITFKAAESVIIVSRI
jgi:hypothetical protein